MTTTFPDNIKYSSPISSSVAALSPDSKYLTINNSIKVTVISTSTMKEIANFPCIDRIESCSFARDSDKIMCFLKERNVIQIFSIVDREWKGRISDGIPGIVNAFWTSDGCSIITECDYGIQTAIWSLLDGQKYIISNPKSDVWHAYKDSIPSSANSHTTNRFWKPKLIAFYNRNSCATSTTTNSSSNEEDHMIAVVHRYELQDYIAIYTPSPTWEELIKFQCRTPDVAHLEWVPNRSVLVTLDSPLTYHVALYTPVGEVIAIYSAYQNALGIRCMSMYTPVHSNIPEGEIPNLSHQLMAIGSFDGKIRLLTYQGLSETHVLNLGHPKDMEIGLTYETNIDMISSTAFVSSDVSIPEGYDYMPINTVVDTNDDYKNKGVTWIEKIASDCTTALIGNENNNPIINKNTISTVTTSTSNTMGITSIKSMKGSSTKGSAGTTFRPDISLTARVASKKTLMEDTIFIDGSKNMKTFPTVTNDARDPKQHLKMGVSWISWCPFYGQFLAARDENQNRCIWIWKMIHDVKLYHIILSLEPILHSVWRPYQPQNNHNYNIGNTANTTIRNPSFMNDYTHIREMNESTYQLTYLSMHMPLSTSMTNLPPSHYPSPSNNNISLTLLAYCTGSSRIYFWSPEYNDSKPFYKDIPISYGISVQSLEWSHDGNFLICYGRESLCICYMHATTTTNTQAT